MIFLWNLKWYGGMCLQWLISPLVPHIYVSVNWLNIGSDNGLTPIWCQSITWTNTDLLRIGPSGTNFSESWIKKKNFIQVAAILFTGRWANEVFNSQYCSCHNKCAWHAMYWWLGRVIIRKWFHGILVFSEKWLVSWAGGPIRLCYMIIYISYIVITLLTTQIKNFDEYDFTYINVQDTIHSDYVKPYHGSIKYGIWYENHMFFLEIPWWQHDMEMLSALMAISDLIPPIASLIHWNF